MPRWLTSKVMNFLTSVTILINILISGANPQCHRSIGKASHYYLSSKRPYFYNSSASYRYIPEGCNPVKFWYFGRHGTRNPGKQDTNLMQEFLPLVHDEIVQAHEEGLGQLCPEEFSILKSWIPRPDLDISERSFLVEQGKWEISAISSRFQTRFPSLFPKLFDNDTYYFRFTNSQRTEASAKAFAEAIFGPDGVQDAWFPQPQDADPILKFYDDCPKWSEDVDENPQSIVEHDDFIKSEIMSQTILKVSQRLGLQNNLSIEEVTILYRTCAYQTAWENGTVSPWCVIFDLDDFKVMSYREDLEYFWKDGYGNEINYKQGCPPFKDAINFFNKHIEDPTTDARKIQVYFSHSGANLKMLAILGLFNKSSVVITSDNFENSKDLYKWRTSQIDFMASNMAFTLYSCPASQSKYQIGYFFNEVPTALPACGNRAFCPFEYFRDNLAELVDTCDLDDICAVDFRNLRTNHLSNISII